MEIIPTTEQKVFKIQPLETKPQFELIEEEVKTAKP
jgi:hypothetical protein